MDTNNKIIIGYQIKELIGKGGCGAVYLAKKKKWKLCNENNTIFEQG